MKWNYVGLSDGNLRQSNMDSLYVQERRIAGEAALLAVVCDGVGSTSDGAYASALATESLEAWFGSRETTDDLPCGLRLRILEIDRLIRQNAQEQNQNTASTISALLLMQSRCIVLHAGDSRIYAVAPNALRQLTRDDVTLDGKLTQYLGKGGGLQLQDAQYDAPSPCFLLCSDGFYKKMPQELLQKAALTSRVSALEALLCKAVEAVKQNGERDNISAIIINRRGTRL